MRATTVSRSEIAAADTMLPSDFLGGDRACHLCGLTPGLPEAAKANPRGLTDMRVDLGRAPTAQEWTDERRCDPFSALLDPDGPRFRCHDRVACARRQGLRRR